jgi:phenylpyruvate tautomerase PptA (4-oxalocrotonate tautomerase family)
MPMIDVTIPEGALKPEAEKRLMKELTDILIRAEGYSPDNKVAQSITWLFLHRPVELYQGGELAKMPRYRIVPTVPEGQYNDANRERLVKECTDAVVRAAGEDARRYVWVFPTELPDGHWGGQGRILRLPEIHALLASGESDRKAGQDDLKDGAERLAKHRSVKAVELLQGALDAIRKVSAAS